VPHAAAAATALRQPLLAFERRGARARGVVGRGGAVTAIQRCGSALNNNVHFHTLVAEGVFASAADGSVCGPSRHRPGYSPIEAA
jgi:Putative transposase